MRSYAAAGVANIRSDDAEPPGKDVLQVRGIGCDEVVYDTTRWPSASRIDQVGADGIPRRRHGNRRLRRGDAARWCLRFGGAIRAHEAEKLETQSADAVGVKNSTPVYDKRSTHEASDACEIQGGELRPFCSYDYDIRPANGGMRRARHGHPTARVRPQLTVRNGVVDRLLRPRVHEAVARAPVQATRADRRCWP